MDLSKYLAKPDKTIREHTDDLINNIKLLNSLGYIKDDYILKLTEKACEYHDYGKANREFQNRIKNQTKFDDSKEIAHNVLSLYFLNEGDFDNEIDYYRVAFGILFHHYYCDNLSALKDKCFKKLSKELLSEFNTYKISLRTPLRIKEMLNDKEAILIKGLVNKCDFSASGGVTIEYKNDFLIDSLNNLLERWKEKNIDSNWNKLQLFCIKNRDENIIAVAQTGMGKTEAGLHWIGNNKGFFILPLKTAINAIYKRVVDYIIEDDKEHKIALLHSDSLSYYNANSDEEKDVIAYYNESRQLSIPVNISTLDQLFDFVFKYKGYEVKLATLSYSRVVIDEIQMYSADLLAYLIYGIKEIIKFGGKVAILTATLAPFIKDLLNEGIEEKDKFKEETFVNDIKRHNIKTYDFKINSDIIYQKYIENESKGISNKILVVCNTVKKAQEVYKELSAKGVNNLNIFHSKFIKKERASKERAILEFGETNNIDSGIWISTQIVEASLDIDFDYLFTELSDISGLFQRLGRCNRKGHKSVENYNCFVFLEIDRNLLTNGDKGFIDEQIYYLSREALENVNGVLSEKEKINIIDKYLTTDKINGSDYFRKYKEFSNWIENLDPYEVEKSDIKLRNIVSFDIIPKVIYEENKDFIESIIENLKDKNIKKVEKVKLIDDIKKFTVSVGKFDIEKMKKASIYKELEINKYQKISVMECEYNDLGFIRGNNKEEIFDNFI